jgi:hypothetical protein
MFISKVIETTVDLFDARDIYTTNIADMLLKKLTDRYRNKCFQSMFITNITKIIRHSDIRMVDNRLDGAAYIDVQFEASGVILIKGEILNGCKVTEVINTGIIIEHNYAGGLIVPGNKQQIFNIIKKGQIIPIIIKEVRYNPGQNEISILGSPFIPQKHKNIFYNLAGGIKSEDVDKLSKLVESLNDEIKLHEEISSEKSYEFFRDLMYPFKTQQKFELSKFGSKFSTVNAELKTLSGIKDGCITSPIEAQKNASFVYHSKTEAKETGGIVITADAYSALSEIVNRRIIYLMGLRGLVKQYDTKDKIGEMMTYWKVCQSLKE